MKTICLNLDQPLKTSELQLSPQQYIKKKRLAFALQALRGRGKGRAEFLASALKGG